MFLKEMVFILSRIFTVATTTHENNYSITLANEGQAIKKKKNKREMNKKEDTRTRYTIHTLYTQAIT